MALFYVLLAVLGGAGQPVQTAMNGRMRTEWGSPVLPALASLVVGAIALGAVLATGVLGRGLVALMLDHFGWLGVERIPLSPWRAAGAVLLLAATWLLQKR